MMEQMKQKDKEKRLALKELLDPFTNPKKQTGAFFSKVKAYNDPCYAVVLGFIGALLMGLVLPWFGFFFMKVEFALMIPPSSVTPNMKDEVNKWCLYMFCLAITAGLCTFVGKFSFVVVGENITMNMRRNLYQALLRKHIGWHDDRSHASGMMTSVLASDVQALNGVSTESFAVMVEALFAVVFGIALAYYFCW